MKSLANLILLLSLCACSHRVALTSSEKLRDDQLARLQYYASDDIVLHKRDGRSNVAVSNGKLVENSYSESDVIVIKKNTPGILTMIDKSDNLAISFEAGEGRYLYFTPYGGIYTLAAKDWKEQTGKLTYEGKTYYAQGGNVYLVVKARVLRKAIRKSRRAAGRKL